MYELIIKSKGSYNSFFRYAFPRKNDWEIEIILKNGEKEEILYREINSSIKTKENFPFVEIKNKIDYWKFLKALFPEVKLRVKNLDYLKEEIDLEFENIPEEIIISNHKPSFSRFSDSRWIKDRINWKVIEKELIIKYIVESK